MTDRADNFNGTTIHPDSYPLQCYLAMTVNISQSVSEISSEEWNALISENNFYNSYEWLYSLEKAFGPTQIFSIRDADQLILGCPLQNSHLQPDLFDIQSLFQHIKVPWKDNFFWIGGPRSTHNEIIYDADKIKNHTLDTLIKSIFEYTHKNKKTGFIMPYVSPSPAMHDIRHMKDIYFILHDAEAFHDVSPAGLAGLLSRLSKHRRASIKYEIKKFIASGHCIQWCNITEEIEHEIIRLITNNRSKYGATDGIAWMRKVFAGQKEAGILDNAIAACSMQGSCMTAVTIFYPWGKTLYARYFGCDYHDSKTDFRYFVLSYYSAMDYAAQHGFNQISFSISALDAKTKRGGRIEPLMALVGLKNTMICKEEIRKYNHKNLKKYESCFKKNLGKNWDLLKSMI